MPVHINRHLVQGHAVGGKPVIDDVVDLLVLIPGIPAREPGAQSIARQQGNGARQERIVRQRLGKGGWVGVRVGCVHGGGGVMKKKKKKKKRG